VTGSVHPALDAAETLPQWLQMRAEQHGAALALRDKQCGIWRTQTWKELEASVIELAVGLRARGFLPDDRLIIDAAPSPAAFRISLAVQWLGGAVVLAGAEAQAPAARFAFAGDDAARVRLVATRLDAAAFALGILLDGEEGPEMPSGWVSLRELAGAWTGAPVPQVATGSTVALVRHPTSAAQRSSPAGVSDPSRRSSTRSHADIVREARALLASGRIGAEDEAVAWRELPLAEQLDSVLAAWLVGGFTFNVAESAETQDADRRELGPSLVFGGADDYAALIARTTQSLPPREGFERRWLESALGGTGRVARLARPLIVHRLREVVGFGRLERAIVLGDATAPAGSLERLFGRSPVHWPARSSDARRAGAEPLARNAPFDLEPTPLGASSRSDLA
jgi:long-chain acyl-CoA synthetase